MLGPVPYAALGIETFRDQVLLPAATLAREPLDVRMGRSPGGRFRRVALGERWGPVWSTAWFRLRGRVPASMRGQRVALRFSSGTEATLHAAGGGPRHGFDPYRDTALLLPRAKGGERIDLLVEAACNLPLGISTFWWDHPEIHARWREERPGRLEACELVAVDEELWRLQETIDLLRRTLLVLPPDDARAMEIDRGLRSIVAGIDANDARHGLRAAAPAIARLLRGEGARPRPLCVAVGHAHIDTAWLWPLAETRRKCVRTFANVLALMERFPSFRFVASQAYQYDLIEREEPELFARIRRRVLEGRWEAGGAMWIEPDCTCPSGESLVRQILHGVGYWSDRFGAAGAQRHLYLPDTFGFPPCLPQIARLAGLDTFITNKTAWSESNAFPHVTFRWRGLDGTEIVAHCTPGHNYNAPLEPSDLVAGARRLVERDGASFAGSPIALWLQPYGFGDGGGGPTAEQALRASLARDCEGLPATVEDTIAGFRERLHAEHARLRRRGEELPAWDGELYLELHRGTYTSQAWLKRQNRLAESLLREVEASLASHASAATRRAARARLDALWKLVLLNQFHDILPGSSIAEVYEDARRDHAIVATEARSERERCDAALLRRFDARGHAEPFVVANPASAPRGGVVACGDRLRLVEPVPALGARLIDAGVATVPSAPASIERIRGGHRLRNDALTAEIDAIGRVSRLLLDDGRGSPRLANPRPMNLLELCEDRPRRWEAWDVDRDHRTKAKVVDGPARIEVLRDDPLRVELRVRRTLGLASELVQTYRLDAGAVRLEVRTEIDWREERTLLRARFPCAVRAAHATFGTQWGAIERPTHRNTSWDEARFEVPGHAWMDLSESGFGVAILDDGKYGRFALGDELALTLLRAPNFPDPAADRGEHVFTYAIMPHRGDWRDAGVDAEAEALREPLRAIAGRPRGRRGAATEVRAPFTIEAEAQLGVQIAAWKPAERSDDRILRIVETRGGRGEVAIRWSDPPREAIAVDLLERPRRRGGPALPTVRHDRRAGLTRLVLEPFRVVTLLVRDGVDA